MKQTSLTALGGIVTALSVFLMFIAGIIPNMTYVIPGFAGLLLIVLLEEAELKWSFFVYIAVGILSLLIVADKEAAVMYVFFFGYYPAVKKLYEKRLPKVLQIALKFLTFNIAIILGYLLLIYIFLIPQDMMQDTFGVWGPVLLLLLGNVVFFLYDRIITMLTELYHKKIHPRVRKMFP